MNINFDVDNLVNIIYETIISLCQKFGIALSWSKDNVVPYVMDALSRYRIMEIVHTSITPLMAILCAVGVFHMYKKSKRERDYFWDDYGNPHLPGVLFITLILILFFTLIDSLINIEALLEWIFVPEIQYIDLIKKAIQ